MLITVLQTAARSTDLLIASVELQCTVLLQRTRYKLRALTQCVAGASQLHYQKPAGLMLMQHHYMQHQCWCYQVVMLNVKLHE
jgi:hypothetical protein